MSSESIIVSRDRGVALVTFNRPERLNAFDPDTGNLWDEIIIGLGTDPEVKVIVLTGAGKGFCAGADAKDVGTGKTEPKLTQPPPGWPHPLYDRLVNAPATLRTRYLAPSAVPQPVIAAVNGAAAGIGLVLAVASDIRMCSTKASFHALFGRRGLVAEVGVAWALPRVVGLSMATDMLMSGRRVSAEEALRSGLVSMLEEPDNLLPRAMSYAREIADLVSPRSLRVIKRQLHMAMQQNQAEALTLAYQEVQASLASEDFVEGFKAFAEGRPPSFTGR